MKKYGFYDDQHIVNEKDENSFSSIDEASAFLLNSLNNCFDIESNIQDGMVILPKWNISIYPRIDEMSEKIVTSHYYISSTEWDEPLFECSTGIGNTQKDALGMSQGSFLFGITDAIMHMINDENSKELQTEFAGHEHSWKVYVGNIVGMGQTPADIDADCYWNALRDQIAKRIGNRKLCYVKIYGANDGNGNIIGECRINNIKSDELSGIVADMVRKWDNTQFGSQKQFFMIKQNEETYIEYPFTISEIKDKTELAMKLFEKCETEEEYDKFPDTLLTITDGDSSLAWELYSFIPEICGSNAFNKLKYPETVLMNFCGETHKYYLTQLYSYYPIVDGVFRVLNRGILNDTNKTYREYISVSSVYSLICAAREKGRDLEADGGEMSTIYNPDDDYIVR